MQKTQDQHNLDPSSLPIRCKSNLFDANGFASNLSYPEGSLLRELLSRRFGSATPTMDNGNKFFFAAPRSCICFCCFQPVLFTLCLVDLGYFLLCFFFRRVPRKKFSQLDFALDVRQN